MTDPFDTVRAGIEAEPFLLGTHSAARAALASIEERLATSIYRGDELNHELSHAQTRAEAAERERDELWALLQEKIDAEPKLDEDILAGYPSSWDYRVRASLATGKDKP